MESTNHFVPAKVPTVQDQVLVKEVPVVELQPVSNLGTKAIHASLYSTVFKTNTPVANGKSSLPQQRYPSQKRVERAANIRRLRQKTQEDSTEDEEVLVPVPIIKEILSTVEVLSTDSEVYPVEPVPTIEVVSTTDDDSEDDDSEDDDSEDDDSEDDDSEEDEDETKRVHILGGVKFNSFPDYVVAKRKRNDKRLEDLGLGPSSSFANKRLKVAVTDDGSTMLEKSSTKKAPPKKKKWSAKNASPVRLRLSSRISGVKTQLVALDLDVKDWNNNNDYVVTQNGKLDYEDPIRKMDHKKKRSYTAPATSNGSFCADFFGGNDPTTTSQNLANCKSTLVDGMKAIKPKLIEEHPAVLGIVGNRVEDHAHKWLLEPMSVMVSGQPISEATTTDPHRKIALMVGNYPKATLSEKDNHQQGLWGMFEKVNTEGSDSEFRFKNPSIDQVRSNFGEIGPNESITCEELEEMIVAVDVFPFQLFYRANVSELLDILKKEFPEFYALYIAYSKLEFESIAHALKRAGQDPNQTPVFTLGSTPYNEITKLGRHLNFVVDIFQSPGRTCHPCSLIDPTSTCGLKRFKESDETLTRVSRFITGDKNMNITFHQRFYENNIETVKEVLKRRSRTAFGGPDQSELSKRVQAEWMFGGPNQCEESKRVQAESRFSVDEVLWDNNLKRAKRYAATSGPISLSVPIHLKNKKATFLSEDEAIDKSILVWILKQRIACTEGYRHRGKIITPMDEQRKIKFQASGLLDQFAEAIAKKDCSSCYKNDEVLWDNNLKRAKRYAATNGPIPLSMPIHLRNKKATFLSEDDVIEKTILGWTILQRTAYRSGHNNVPMDEGRKIKFLASGLLESEHTDNFTKNENLWDNNLKRAKRYAAISGPIPSSLPTRLRRKGRVLSEDEVIEKAILRWIILQKKKYKSGRNMDEGRKIKFLASGLLL